MAMTKKERGQLIRIMQHLERTVKYLQDDKIVGIASKLKSPGNGGDYTLNNLEAAEVLRTPEYICLHNKNVGSDITGVYMALRSIKSLLFPLEYQE